MDKHPYNKESKASQAAVERSIADWQAPPPRGAHLLGRPPSSHMDFQRRSNRGTAGDRRPLPLELLATHYLCFFTSRWKIHPVSAHHQGKTQQVLDNARMSPRTNRSLSCMSHGEILLNQIFLKLSSSLTCHISLLPCSSYWQQPESKPVPFLSPPPPCLFLLIKTPASAMYYYFHL